MGLWKLWLVGLAITIVTGIVIHKKVKIHKIFVDILVATNIAVVGGIAEGWFFFSLLTSEHVVGKIGAIIGITLLIILSSVLIWIVGSLILCIFKKNQFRVFEIIIFILVYIIASVCWAKSFINYNRNIEDINETVVIEKQENQLLYFCNIPLQQISGNISGDVSGSALWVDGNISGSISTSEELPYWYLNENGEGKYNSVSASSSKIRFIKENEKPYVEVITYRYQIRTVNHNNGKETTETQSEWKEYIFYLPQAIMQYPLD